MWIIRVFPQGVLDGTVRCSLLSRCLVSSGRRAPLKVCYFGWFYHTKLLSYCTTLSRCLRRRALFWLLRFIIPSPPFLFGLQHFWKATRGCILALLSALLYKQCLLALSMHSRTATGICRVHMAQAGKEERTVLTSWSLPAWVKRLEVAVSLLSILLIMKPQCSTLGFGGA